MIPLTLFSSASGLFHSISWQNITQKQESNSGGLNLLGTVNRIRHGTTATRLVLQILSYQIRLSGIMLVIYSGP